MLDGDGHTVTFAGADKYPNPVINILGPKGIIQNLGVKGSISNPALVNKLDGKLINCYAMLGRTVSDTGGDQYSCRPCVGWLAW